MRIIVSDSSCLIDLRKASLLEAFLRLPYEILIPNTLFEDELLKFTAAQKRTLISGGLKVIDLPGKQVVRARQVIRQMPQLSVNDGFAFALAENNPGCVLLTGDSHLHKLASTGGIEVHGILWVIDELFEHKVSTAHALHGALHLLASDPAIRLPRHDVASYLRRYRDLRSDE